MASDPRLELARRMVAGGDSMGGSSVSLQQRAAQQYAEYSKKKKGGPVTSGNPTLPGWKGVLAGALDNPVVKPLLQAANTLDLGRSTVVSGVKELNDFLDMKEDTRASWKDFVGQTKNHIGFGDIIAEQGGLGNKWLDRIAGLAGDVLLDPTTYLTLGASSMAGLTGRVGLAADIATQGARNVTAGRITKEALDEIVQRAGTKGIAKLTTAERAAYNLPEAGLRFMGKRIGGTEKLAGVVGGGLADLRTGITTSKTWGRVFDTGEGMLRRAPDNLEQAYTKLATGRGRISPTAAATLVAGANTKAAKGGSFAGVWGRVAHDIYSGERDAARRVDIARMVELGDLSDETAAATAKLLEDVRVAHAAATGKEIPKRANYFPHMWSRYGRNLLSGDTPLGQDLRKIITFTKKEVNDLGYALERKIEAGTYDIAGKKVTFKSGTIDDINRTIQEAFPDVVGTQKVLLDDAPVVVANYIKAIGEDVGNKALLDKLNQAGIAISKSDATQLVADESGTKAANEAAAKNYKTVLEKGKPAYDAALKDARVSAAEATKSIAATLKVRLGGLRTRSKALTDEWNRIQGRLSAANVDFDSAIAELNAAELSIQDNLVKAYDDYNRFAQRLDDDIAAAGAEERLLTKQRLELRRQAKARLEVAKSRVAELEAHQAAYKDLTETVQRLRSEVEQAGTIDVKNLPEGARDVIRYRTVAEQRAIDASGTAGNEVVNQVVRLGTQGDEAFGLAKRLKIDVRGAGSVLRQTIDDAAGFIGEQFQVELGRLKNLLDDAYGVASDYSDKTLSTIENKINGLVSELQNAKATLANRMRQAELNPGYDTSNIVKQENKVRGLENAIKASYDDLEARIAARESLNVETSATLRFSPSLPGNKQEQALRQISDEVSKVKQSVYDDAIARGLSESTAQLQADVFEKTFKAVEVFKRSKAGAPGSGAYIVAAQDSLAQSIKKARISSDYETRLAAVLGELERVGAIPTAAQRPLIENLVMREVLESYKRTLQTQLNKVVDDLDNYANQAGKKIDESLRKTKAYNKAVKEAEQTWDFVKSYVEEFRAALDEAAAGRAYQVGAEEGQMVSGRLARQQVFNSMMRDTDFIQSIALVITGDAKSAAAYAKTPEFRKIMSAISGSLGPDSKKFWIDAIAKVRSKTPVFTPKSEIKAANWVELSAQAGRRQVDELTKEIDVINRQVAKLKPTMAAAPGSKEALESVSFYETLLSEFRAKLNGLNGIVLKDVPDEAKRQEIRIAREAAEQNVNIVESAIEQLTVVGRVAKAPKLNAQDVIDGVVRRLPSDNQKKLAETWAKITELEGKASDILENTGALAARVQDVPGRQSIFNKAKNYIAVIDEELAMLGQRVKGKTGATQQDIKAYIKQLKDERKVLVQAIDNATPLDERIASAAKQVDELKSEVKSLTGKGNAEIFMQSKRAGLEAQLVAVAEGRTAQEVKAAADTATNEALKAGVRDTYDATVKAAQDSLKVVEESRSKIESMIPAMEEVMRQLPKPKGIKSTDDVNAVFEWLSDAYAMIDPDGFTQRMAGMPDGMTPAMLKPGGTLNANLSNREMVAALRALPNDPEARTALALIYKAHEDAGRLLTLIGDREYNQTMLKMAKDRQLFTVLKEQVKDGFEELASSGLFVPTEVADVMKRVVSLDNTTGSKLLDTVNYYTDTWKAIKTTSPRFHIRNAISATFMNFVFGVSPNNMKLGAKMFLEFERNPQTWIKNIDPKYRPYVQDILDAVFASGGGQYGEIDNAATALSQKGVFRYSKMKGTSIEGSVRMGMALEYMLPKELGGRGMSFDNTVGVITKAHFNYSQLSKLDRKARAFIPFWTFMSRNLPLQLEQAWLNPRAYAVYNNIARNMRDEEEGEIVPQWIRETQGWKLPFGEGLFATPDIGVTRVSQDLAQLSDPIRLGQNLNPLVRTPIELFAGKQFYKDIPISGDKYVELSGARKAFLPILEAANLVERAPNGAPVISEKTNYALMQLVPGLAETERLIAPSMENYKEKVGQSRFSFFTGLPMTKVGPTQILGEQLRQKREAEAKKKKVKAISKAVD